MFGYVKPNKAELLVKEYEFYKAVYCGVCRSLKSCTGALSNILHTYDSAFLALVRMLYVPDSQIGVIKKRCAMHPVRKKPMLKRNDATDYMARAFAILTYYKIKDDISDEKLGKKLAVSVLRPIFASAKNKAALKSVADICEEKLSLITELERAKVASVDEPAKLFGELLGAIFSEGLSDSDKLVTYRLGFHLGKFIYAADAAEDYGKDKESGKYNPYVLAYGGRELTDENKRTIKCALLLECRKIETAVNLLPFGKRAVIENIINNVIYLGLPKRIEFLDTKDENEEDEGKV